MARKSTNMARKRPVRVLIWPVRVLLLVPLWADYGLQVCAGSYHYLLARPTNFSRIQLTLLFLILFLLSMCERDEQTSYL